MARSGQNWRSIIVRIFLLTVLTTCAANAQTFTVLHSFTGGDGANPVTGLTIDASGNFYGTTEYGGNSEACGNGGCGTVFRLKHAGSGFILEELVDFNGSTGAVGAHPLGRVSFGPDGTLYGSTEGTVFSMRPPATFCPSISCPWSETVLFTTGYGTGEILSGDLAFDAAGNIYGTTEIGPGEDFCNSGCGAVYQLTNSGGTWTENLIQEFHGVNGQYPYSGVILDHAGNVYGVTPEGADWGTFFELSPSSSGWLFNLLYRFQDGADGAEPWGGLIMDASGNIYGTTSAGGANNGGTVWEMSPGNDGWTFSALYELAGNSSSLGPHAKLVMDSAGNLYGSTVQNGAYGFGSIFKLTPSSGGWTYTSLHDFTGRSDGAYPYDGLVLDANGNIYGTTYGGGNFICTGGVGCGVVFEITP